MRQTQKKHAGPSPLRSFLDASVITKIIVVTVAVYLIDNLLLRTPNLSRHDTLGTIWLGLDHGLFTKHTRFWQLLTYGFVHSPMAEPGGGLRHILFNMYGLWLFGRPLEYKYGGREFLVFYLFAIVVSALAWTLCQIFFGQIAVGLIGASGAVTAAMVLFALSFPQARMQLFFIPISFPVWVLGIFLILNDVRGAVTGGDNVAYAVHLAGAVIALIYFLTNFSFTGRAAKQRQHQHAKAARSQIAAKKQPRHKCSVCERTEMSDPELEFRYCSKCDGTPCYCMEHLQTHEHTVAAPSETAK